MINLEKRLYNTDSFVDLELIIEDVAEDISFWGRRYVYLKGEKETFSIHILAKRVLELMEQHRFEYTNDERAAGKRIAAKINHIYEDNIKRLDGKWFITRILCYIRDQMNSCSPCVGWTDGRRNFKLYTERQYQEEFHSKPNKKDIALETWYQDIGHTVLYYAPKIAINVNG